MAVVDTDVPFLPTTMSAYDVHLEETCKTLEPVPINEEFRNIFDSNSSETLRFTDLTPLEPDEDAGLQGVLDNPTEVFSYQRNAKNCFSFLSPTKNDLPKYLHDVTNTPIKKLTLNGTEATTDVYMFRQNDIRYQDMYQPHAQTNRMEFDYSLQDSDNIGLLQNTSIYGNSDVFKSIKSCKRTRDPNGPVCNEPCASVPGPSNIFTRGSSTVWEVCEKELLSKRNVHSGENIFDCEVRKKSFVVERYLKLHKRIHSGEKLFHCKICNWPFTSKGNLKQHELIHTGAKPYKCDVCPKSFTRRADLNRHQLVHTGAKTFQCDVCGKSFAYKASLKRHKRVHT